MVSNPFSDGLSVRVSSDVSEFNSGIDGAIGKLQTFRTQVGLAGAAIGTLSAAGMAEATESAANFEEQMVDVEKVTNPQTAEEMSESIQDMAGEMPLAQERLAGITEQAGRFGIEGVDNIERFTRTVGEMSVATDLTAEESGEAFARMTKLMDEPTSNVRDLGDTVNGLSNNMATSASEITDASTRSAGALNQLGLSSEQIVALNGAMNEVSPSARRAGTRLRRFAQEIQDPKKVGDMADALGMTKDEFVEMRENSPNELMQTMVERFAEGGDSADTLRETLSTTSRQALANLAQNTESWNDAQEMANEQMGDGASLADEYETAASTTNSRIQTLKNRFRNLAITTGEQFLPVLNDALDHINNLVNGFATLNERTDGMVGALTLVVGAVGGFAVALGGLVPVASTVAGGLSTIAGAAGGLGAALSVLTGPVGVVIAAIGLLAAAWIKNWGDIQGITRRTVNWVIEHVQELVQKVRSFWKEHKDEIFATVRDLWQGVQDIVDRAVADVQNLWDKHGDEIIATAKRFWGLVEGFIESFTKLYKKHVTDSIDRVLKLWEIHGDDLVQEVKETWDTMMSRIDTILGILLPLINKYLDKITAFWDKWGDEIMTVINFVMGFVKTFVTNQLDGILTAFRFVLNLIQGDWGEAFNVIKEFVRRSLNRISNFVDRWDLADKFSKIIDAAKGAVWWLIGNDGNTFFGLLKSMQRDAADWAKKTGKSLISGAFDAIVGAIKGVWKDFHTWLIGGSKVKDIIKDVANYLSNMGETLIVGGFGALVEGAKGALEYLWGTGPNTLYNDVTNGIGDIASWVMDTASTKMENAFDDVTSAIKDAFEINVDWPEPPEIVKKAYKGELDIDWPDPPSFIDDDGNNDGDGNGDGNGGGGGGGGGGCFVAGTPVRTPDGSVAIDAVEPGDTVVSYDADRGALTQSTVGEVLVHADDHDFDAAPLLEITIRYPDGDERTTRVTANHQYYVPLTGEYAPIGDLDVGTRVRAAGGFGWLAGVDVVDERPTVYNLHMAEGPHSYLANGIVVHNAKIGLQHGGIVNAGSGMPAMLHGTEAVMPLDKLPDLMGRAMDRAGGGTTVEVNIDQVNAEDGADFGRRLERELQSRGWRG